MDRLEGSGPSDLGSTPSRGVDVSGYIQFIYFERCYVAYLCFVVDGIFCGTKFAQACFLSSVCVRSNFEKFYRTFISKSFIRIYYKMARNIEFLEDALDHWLPLFENAPEKWFELDYEFPRCLVEKLDVVYDSGWSIPMNVSPPELSGLAMGDLIFNFREGRTYEISGYDWEADNIGVGDERVITQKIVKSSLTKDDFLIVGATQGSAAKCGFAVEPIFCVGEPKVEPAESEIKRSCYTIIPEKLITNVRISEMPCAPRHQHFLQISEEEYPMAVGAKKDNGTKNYAEILLGRNAYGVAFDNPQIFNVEKRLILLNSPNGTVSFPNTLFKDYGGYGDYGGKGFSLIYAEVSELCNLLEGKMFARAVEGEVNWRNNLHILELYSKFKQQN